MANGLRKSLAGAALMMTIVATPQLGHAQSHILPKFMACLAQAGSSGSDKPAVSECHWQHWERQSSGR